jgi:hypothetical protein
MKSKLLPLIIIFFNLLFTGCQDKQDIVRQYTVKGYAQKGPFLNGTDVSIAEYDKKLFPTGKIFFSTITDNTGSFQIPNISLISDFVLIKAEGRFFNEILNGINSNEITLYSFADISEGAQINVNLMTHILMDRMQYLVQSGKSFHIARQQSLNELLHNFSLADYTVEMPEKLDITGKTISDAILLALTTVISGELSNFELTDFLTNLRMDLKEDGSIDISKNQQLLKLNAFFANPDRVRNNLQNRYRDMGIDIEIPDFSNYIEEFAGSSSFQDPFGYLYPAQTEQGKNLLTLGFNSDLDTSENYCIALRPVKTEKELIIYIQTHMVSESGNFESPVESWDEIIDDVYYIARSNNNWTRVDIPVKLYGSGQMQMNFAIYNKEFGGRDKEIIFEW